MLLLGIDPGLDGALAFMDAMPGSVPRVADMPTLALSRGGKNKREIDAHVLADALSAQTIGHAFVELAGPRPLQNVSGVFVSGKGYGIVIGTLTTLGVPYTFVSPVKWKRALGVPAAKDGARARASQLLPGAAYQWKRVRDDGRAEASLIVLWGQQYLANIARAA